MVILIINDNNIITITIIIIIIIIITAKADHKLTFQNVQNLEKIKKFYITYSNYDDKVPVDNK